MRNVAYLVGIVATIAIASHFAFDLARAGSSSFYLFLAVPTVALAIAGVMRAKDDGVLRNWFGLKRGDFARGFAAAAVLFGSAYTFTKLVAPPTSPRASWLARIYLQLGDPSDLRKNVAFVAFGIILMALAEELLWRGLVIALLEEVIGSSRAWVWAAVLYSVAHAPTVWALRDPVAGLNPCVVVAALGAGLLWGGMARRFERLAPGFFSHALFDWCVVMTFRLWGPSV